MELTRRDLVRRSLAAGAAYALLREEALAQTQTTTSPSAISRAQQSTPITESADLHWLEPNPSKFSPGVTWGVPWPRGVRQKGDRFELSDRSAVQTWPFAYWPDGSLKWTAHATTSKADALTLSHASSDETASQRALTVEEKPGHLVIDTGVIRIEITANGSDTLIRSIRRGEKVIAENVRLVMARSDHAGMSAPRSSWMGTVHQVTVEQSGPIRATLKLEGTHAADARMRLPFVVRLYAYAGSDAVRIVHSFIYDGEQHRDFIAALGVIAEVPMGAEVPLHDRHIRFTGEENGLWAEAVQNLSGLRRDPGRAFIDAQIAGQACPPLEEMAAPVRERLQYVPAWKDFSLRQLSPDAFDVRKRTYSSGVTWIKSANGGRASGLVYVGSAQNGGVLLGLRDFWQRYPTQLDIQDAHSDRALIMAWMYSPDAEPMDLRPYHDEMGMDTHEKQYKGGLEITYEDYEPGFDSPYGVARTSELMLWAVEKTPAREDYAEYARALQSPPLLVCEPERYQQLGLFGGMWNVPDRSSSGRAKIEDELDFEFAHYLREREQRRWYGFWDYGDVMHTYDRDRHVWRYDVGGFAWANSELSPDLWLWYSFVRTGRADIFRFAEAMTRHTGEVDVYHLGKWKGFGSRHNVLHWGDSSKQLRISTPIYRRIFYYLTADERVGDLMREIVDADNTFLEVDPIRKIREGKYEPKPEALSVGLHTDWGSLATAWLIEWERGGNEIARTKLMNGIRTIGELPNGFFHAGATYNMADGKFTPGPDPKAVGLSHLAAVFGLPEICAELISLFPEETKFRDAWVQYCELYNASPEDREKALGNKLSGNSLTTAHSRLTAYAAKMKNDPALAQRAWTEFVSDARWSPTRYSGKTTRVDGPEVLRPIEEVAWMSTNDTSTWGLAAIENLSLIGDALPADLIPPKPPTTRPQRSPRDAATG